MNRICQWRGLRWSGLSLAFLALSGCQTWMAGMTLPSGHYLEHPPQYIPPSPPFPLPREVASQEAAAAAAAAPAFGAPAAVPLPPPVAPAVPPVPPGVPPVVPGP
jgi:hypothetical protein